MRAPPAFSIFYATGWQESVLRVRLLNPDGTPQHPVRRLCVWQWQRSERLCCTWWLACGPNRTETLG